MADRKNWRLVIADDLDYGTASQIARLMYSFSALDSRKNFFHRRSHAPEYYLWKIRNNPAGPGFVSLAFDDEKIIGSVTITSKKAWFRGQIFNAGLLGEGITDPEYERQGIFSTLLKATRDRAINHGVNLIYGTPTKNSIPPLERCSIFSKRGLNLFLWILPLKPAFIISKKLDKMSYLLLHRAIDKLTGISFRSLSAIVPKNAERVPLFFDSSYDELDENLRRKHTFMFSRNAAELNYRLVDNPDSYRYGLIVKRARKNELEAALVYKNVSQDGMKVLFIADLFGIGSLSMTQVWNAAILLGLEEDCDMLLVWAPKRFSSFFSMFVVPPVPVFRRELIFYDNSLGREVLNDNGHWLFSMLDSNDI